MTLSATLSCLVYWSELAHSSLGPLCGHRRGQSGVAGGSRDSRMGQHSLLFHWTGAEEVAHGCKAVCELHPVQWCMGFPSAVDLS